jgi:NAD(P)-dependent dehydrogenase (short-subunit alcohol dehydrogenase family)
MSDPLDMSGRVVIVTGGCRGIGRGIAARFLSAGAQVVVCCRHRPDDLPSGVDADGKSRTAHFVEADVRDPDQVDRMVTFTTERLGRLDVLVNNAGGSPPADAATASPRFSSAIITLNLIAPLYCAQRANQVMQSQEGGGCIINIGSVSGIRPSPTSAAYGAAKAGLVSLAQSLAVEWGPKVRVNTVSAGLIRTEQSHLFYGDEAGIAAVGATVPLGRMGEPEDVADVCLFLASELARYVSGENVVVHGGGERPAFLDAATPTEAE